eukprot:jgi/Botrbrau1/7439/Bobra.0083s0012.1
MQIEACSCIFDLSLRQSYLFFGCRNGRRSCRTCISRAKGYVVIMTEDRIAFCI